MEQVKRKIPTVQSLKDRVPVRKDIIHGEGMPEIARINIDYYLKRCQELGLSHLAYRVKKSPPSVNHIYNKSRRRGKGQYDIVESVKLYRDLTMEALDQTGKKWKPVGVTAGVILFANNGWIRKDGTVALVDADNKIKTALDATEIHTRIGDERFWDLHVFKVCSKKTHTDIYLFDLGDVVQYFSP